MIDRRTFVAGCAIGALSLSAVGCSSAKPAGSSDNLSTVDSIDVTPNQSESDAALNDVLKYVWLGTVTHDADMKPIVVEASIPESIKDYRVTFFALSPDTPDSPEIYDVDNVFKTDKKRMIDEIDNIHGFARRNDVVIPFSEEMQRIEGLFVDQCETTQINDHPVVIAQGYARFIGSDYDSIENKYGVHNDYARTCTTMYVHFNVSDHPDLDGNSSLGACALVAANDEFQPRDVSYDPDLIPDMKSLLEQIAGSMQVKILKDTGEYSAIVKKCYSDLNQLYT